MSETSNVYVWDVASRNLMYCLPGHKGSVNEVDFHPKEPIGEHYISVMR